MEAPAVTALPVVATARKRGPCRNASNAVGCGGKAASADQTKHMWQLCYSCTHSALGSTITQVKAAAAATDAAHHAIGSGATKTAV